MDTKTCSKCGDEFPATTEYWHRDNRSKDGLLGHCKTCEGARRQKRRSTEEGRSKHNAANVKRCIERLKNDAWFRLRHQLKTETNKLLKQLAINKGTEYMCLKIFGADRQTVHAQIDGQLQARGFKWENHGTEWQLDHIKPLALAQSSIELYQLCQLANTQVLTPEENAIKGVEDQKLIKQREA